MSTNFPGTAIDSYTTKSSGDTVSESHINNLQDAVVALETKVGINSSAVTTTLDYLVKNFISSGRKVWIYADSSGGVPTGWTHYSTAADCVIGVKGGSNAYNVTGGTGTLYGTWTQPSHSHVIKLGWGSNTLYDASGAGPSTDGGSHAMDGYRARLSTSTSVPYLKTETDATAITWRPYAAVGIIIEKS
jgi:hypothetical protein